MTERSHFLQFKIISVYIRSDFSEKFVEGGGFEFFRIDSIFSPLLLEREGDGG